MDIQGNLLCCGRNPMPRRNVPKLTARQFIFCIKQLINDVKLFNKTKILK